MPKTFVSPEQSRIRVQQQRQAGYLQFLDAMREQDEDEDEDEDDFSECGPQAWMDEQGPLNLPINGIAPGTSTSFARAQPVAATFPAPAPSTPSPSPPLSADSAHAQEIEALTAELQRIQKYEHLLDNYGDVEPLRQLAIVAAAEKTAGHVLNVAQAQQLLQGEAARVRVRLTQALDTRHLTDTSPVGKPPSDVSTSAYLVERLSDLMKTLAHSHSLNARLSLVPGAAAVYSGATLLARIDIFRQAPSLHHLTDVLWHTPWAAILPQAFLVEFARTIWEQLTPQQLQQWVQSDDATALNIFIGVGYLMIAFENKDQVSGLGEHIRNICTDPFNYLFSQIVQMSFAEHDDLSSPAAEAPPVAAIPWVDWLVSGLGHALTATSVLKNIHGIAQLPAQASEVSSAGNLEGGIDLSLPGPIETCDDQALIQALNGLCDAPQSDLLAGYFARESLTSTTEEQLGDLTLHTIVSLIERTEGLADANRPEEDDNDAADIAMPWSRNTSEPEPAAGSDRASVRYSRADTEITLALGGSIVAGNAVSSWASPQFYLPATVGALTLFTVAYLLWRSRDESKFAPSADATTSLMDNLTQAIHNATLATPIPGNTTASVNDTATTEGIFKPVDRDTDYHHDDTSVIGPIPERVAKRDATVRKLDSAATSLEFFIGRINTILQTKDSAASMAASAGSADEYGRLTTALQALGIATPAENTAPLLEPQFVTVLTQLKTELGSVIADLQYLGDEMNAGSVNLDYFAPPSNDVQTLLTDVVEVLPSGFAAKNREMWKIITNARVVAALREFVVSERYENVLSGLTNHVSSLADDMLDAGFIPRTKQLVRESFRITHAEWDNNHVIAQKFNAWKSEVNQIIADPGRQVEHGRIRVRMQTALGSASAAEVRQIMQLLRQNQLQRLLNEKLEELPASLLSATDYGDLKARLAARLQRQQFGRLLGSIPSILNFANHVVNAQYTNSTVRALNQQLSAATEFFAATKVPSTYLISLIEKRFDKGIPWKQAANEVFSTGLRKPAAATDNIALQELRHGRQASAQLHHLDRHAINALSLSAERNLFSYRGIKESLKETGRQSFYLINDILALAGDAYKFDHTPSLAGTAQNALITRLTADSAFLTATLIPLTVSGRLPTGIARTLLTSGVGLNLAAGALDIQAMQEANASPLQIGLAATQLSANTMTTLIGMRFPLIGTVLAFALPDITAAGRARNYYDLYLQYKAQGLTTKANLAYRLYQMSIAEAVPIVSLFMPLVRNAVAAGSSLTQGGLTPWLATAAHEEFAARNAALQPSLRSFRPRGVQQLHYIVPQNASFNYGLHNPQPHAMTRTLQQSRDVVGWTAFSENGWRAISPPRSTLRGPTNGYVQFDDAAFQRAFASRNFTDRPGVRNRPANNADLALMYIRRGQSVSGNIPKLTLNNSLSNINTIYDVRGIAGGRIINGAGNATFSLERMLSDIDGGSGAFNTINFGNHLDDAPLDIDMRRARKIHLWLGSNATNRVTGTEDRDRYVADYQPGGGTQDDIDLRGGDDFAQVHGGSIDMGPGNDQLYLTGVAQSSRGGEGDVDTLSFSLLNTTEYSNLRVQGNDVSADRADRGGTDRGTISGFEVLLGPMELNTDIDVTAASGLRAVRLGNETNTVRVGRGNLAIFPGNGTNTVSSAPGIAAYDDILIVGAAGDDTITLELVDSANVVISSGSGNNLITLSARSGSSGNKVETSLGKGKDKLVLRGDMEVDVNIYPASGSVEIMDHLARESPMRLHLHGVTMSQVSARAQRNDVIEDGNGTLYPLVWTVQAGGTVCTVYGYTNANLIVTTPQDNGAKKITLG